MPSNILRSEARGDCAQDAKRDRWDVVLWVERGIVGAKEMTRTGDVSISAATSVLMWSASSRSASGRR